MTAKRPILVLAGEFSQADQTLKSHGFKPTFNGGLWEHEDGRHAVYVSGSHRLHGMPRGSEYVLIGSIPRRRDWREMRGMLTAFGCVEIKLGDLA